MPQLYFLSVLCNGIAGYLLFADDNESPEKTPFPVKTPTFHLVLGIMCAVTGVLKLLSPSMDGILIFGDLIPAAAGILAGITIIFGIYRKDLSENKGELDRLGTSLLVFRKQIGIGLMAAAVIHFLFPHALFL
jgi:hypothetical protein